MILYTLNLVYICFLTIIYKVPMPAANNSWGITVHIPLTRNEHYALSSLAWNFDGEIREVSKLFIPPHPPHTHSPIIYSTWLGGRILSAGLVYFRCASDAVFGACL